MIGLVTTRLDPHQARFLTTILDPGTGERAL